jgi:hypothetical protein
MLFVFLPFSFLPEGVKIAGYVTRSKALNFVSAFTFFLFFFFSPVAESAGEIGKMSSKN